jgi:hypothetical protein
VKNVDKCSVETNYNLPGNGVGPRLLHKPLFVYRGVTAAANHCNANAKQLLHKKKATRLDCPLFICRKPLHINVGPAVFFPFIVRFFGTYPDPGCDEQAQSAVYGAGFRAAGQGIAARITLCTGL